MCYFPFFGLRKKSLSHKRIQSTERESPSIFVASKALADLEYARSPNRFINVTSLNEKVPPEQEITGILVRHERVLRNPCS